MDTYRLLHPTAVAFTLVMVLQGKLTSARRLDSIWVSSNLATEAMKVLIQPSSLDHSMINLSLQLMGERIKHGPGKWHLHQSAHLEPIFGKKLKRLINNIPAEISSTIVWFSYVERICTSLFNISVDYSKKQHQVKTLKHELVATLISIEIWKGRGSQVNFMGTLDDLHQLEL